MHGDDANVGVLEQALNALQAQTAREVAKGYNLDHFRASSDEYSTKLPGRVDDKLRGRPDGFVWKEDYGIDRAERRANTRAAFNHFDQNREAYLRGDVNLSDLAKSTGLSEYDAYDLAKEILSAEDFKKLKWKNPIQKSR